MHLQGNLERSPRPGPSREPRPGPSTDTSHNTTSESIRSVCTVRPMRRPPSTTPTTQARTQASTVHAANQVVPNPPQFPSPTRTHPRNCPICPNPDYPIPHNMPLPRREISAYEISVIRRRAVAVDIPGTIYEVSCWFYFCICTI